MTDGHIAFDLDGDIRTERPLSRADMIDYIATGECLVLKVWYVNPINQICRDMTAEIVNELWDVQFRKQRGEEIENHLEGLYMAFRPKGYTLTQTHYVDTW